MKKKLLAALLCVSLVLGMIPNTIAFRAEGESTNTLALDQEGKGWCSACSATVTWTQVKNGDVVGSLADNHKHYYLPDNVTAGPWQFMELNANAQVCLHLNGHNLTAPGQCVLWTDTSTLNIMGTGNVDFTGATSSESTMKAAIYNYGGTVNLYGGTYTVSGAAATAGKPVVLAKTQVTLNGAAVSGSINMEAGNLTLQGGTTVADIFVGSAGKLTVRENWTGNAQVSFATALVNGVVPAANGCAEGSFTGSLKLTNGSELEADDGLLAMVGRLELDANSQAQCPVCKESATWTQLQNGGNIGGQPVDSGHLHYYLAGNVTAASKQFMELSTNTQVCLHLNGNNLTIPGRCTLWTDSSVLNIMGTGNVDFTGSLANYDNAAIYAWMGVVNLYGGTYTVSGAAAAAGKPFVLAKKADTQVTLDGAAVSGPINMEQGNLTLQGESAVAEITVGSAGKLTVSEDWTGSAKVSFTAELVNNVVPAANGYAEGSFTGSLKLSNGNKLQAGANGSLVAIDQNANLALDANSQAWCPVCDETVTWKKVVNADVIGGKTNQGHLHYYLAGNVTAGPWQFMELSNTQVCLHLNGKSLTIPGQCVLWTDTSTLNIMGTGNVDFTGATSSENTMKAAIYNYGGSVNLYGGTYTVSGAAATAGKPVVLAKTQVTLNGAAVSGPINMEAGNLTLRGKSTAADIVVGSAAKLTVGDSWSGEAQVSFTAALVNGVVPAANGYAEGSFTGSLKLPDGSKLQADANGLLEVNGRLELDANSQAQCPVCKESATWTPVTNGESIGGKTNAGHLHYYLTSNMTAASAQFMELSNTQVCLHLNGNSLTLPGQCTLWADAVLNIMGTGNVNFTGAVVSDSFKHAAIYNYGGAVNLYGGTYTVSGAAAEAGKPVVLAKSGTQVVLNGATVSGLIRMDAGNLTMLGKSNVDHIYVDNAAKLTVDSTWFGIAEVAFATGLPDGAVPGANGASTGDFVGALRMQDGTLLRGNDGKLMKLDETYLRLTETRLGYCSVCRAMVKWEPLNDRNRIGTLSTGHHHYYFAQDNITTTPKEQLVILEGGAKLCLHLNNKDVKVSGSIQLNEGTLNVLGDGHLDFLADGQWKSVTDALFNASSSKEKTINIYGGTYTSSSGKPVLQASGGNFTVYMIVNLYGKTNFDGVAKLNQCQLYLQDSVKVKYMDASNSASIRVDANWRGTATVDYFNEYKETYISEYNGRSTGDFVGGLTMADGRRLVGESGKLRIVEAGQLFLNEQNQGYCEACNKIVTWTAVNGQQDIGDFADGGHHHYYLSGDLQMPDTLAQMLSISNTKLCLHLNGKNMVYGGRILVEDGAVLNILGEGDVTFTADSTADEEDNKIAGLYSTGDTELNLLGGTYSVSGKALEQGKPVIYALGSVLIKNAQVKGLADVREGTLRLDAAAEVDKIVVGAAGQLDLADSWAGIAKACFAKITGNTIPAGNLAGTAYTGSLTLTDGRAVTGREISGEKVDANLTYKTSEDNAEIISYTGSGNYLLPTHIAGKPVTAIADGAFASFTGTLYIGKNHHLLAYAKEKGLKHTEASSFTQDNGVVQLLDNATNLTFGKDTVLDLNGYHVNGVTVTGGTLYVMDSQTDDFTVEDGYGYGKMTNISGAVKAADGYMRATEEDNVSSFHRVDLKILAMTLRTTNAGVYYKSRFVGDEVVASLVKSYGVALSVKAEPNASNLTTHCGFTTFTGFEAGEGANTGSSTLLKGIMKQTNGDQKNASHAAMNIYGRAYIETADGYIFGDTVERSLQEQVKLADEGFEELTKGQKKNAQAMFETYGSVMERWGLSGFGNYKDRLWFKEPAPDTGVGFEEYSLPIGNGYMGVTVFGGTESETLSISDKEMFNPIVAELGYTPPAGPDGEVFMSYGAGGYANMCKAHIDFGHDFAQVSNYQRDLVLETAEAHVRYDYDGVTYNRTYFASYPDNVTVMKLDASQSGKLSFTLRPEATYVRDYCSKVGDGLGKTGTVTASGDTAIVAGTLTAFNVNYEAQFKVIPVGGTMVANDDGTITVENADSAVILLTVDTNYELKPETLAAPNSEKLDPNSFPHDKVTAVMDAAAKKTYEQLLETHLADYQELYCRVELDLGGAPSTDTPTGELVQAYRTGEFDPYLEELLFKYGRYLLIASSRSGTLPANLQGVWQYYSSGAWGGGYVYNINLQMNYWSCFATNLAELFGCNIEFFDAIWPTLQGNADNFLTGIGSPNKTANGTNGIAVGAVGTPYKTPSVDASIKTHTGPGSTGYTSSLFWEYYQFTKNEEALKKIYPYLEGAATFLSKTLEDYDGKWLVSHSASPENNLYFKDPFITKGTMFDQMMVRESFVQVREAARLLQLTPAESKILNTIEVQFDKLDHVNVGKDGHVKEYREEEYYGDYGLYEHHGMGQLVGVYPGTSINSTTDAWQDAAATTAFERGINFSGHQASFKQLVWARLGDSVDSYLLAQEHIVRYIRDNLWNTHAPFQIDGNFGYTAGVAEMLIQSHEGYIKVLPALPEQWNTGSYKGLTARGGFEVDVAWENGNATKITITSTAGESCSLNHFRISDATVTDSNGNPVAFTVDSADQITFATVKGETYHITDLSAEPKVATPADLTLTGGTLLSWKASPDAVSYKVYRVVNDQATYELVAENVTCTTYTYNPTDLKDGDQLILRVTAVNADGVESDGVRTITWVEDQD